jgi:trehalose synthase-fused probable maltokinase
MTNDLQLTTQQLAALEAVLPAYMLSKRWFRAKAYTIASVQIVDAYQLPASYDLRLTIARVNYEQADPDRYVLLLRLVSADDDSLSAIGDVLSEIARLPDGLVVYDATADPAVALGLLSAIRVSGGQSGAIAAWRTGAFVSLDPGENAVQPSLMGVEQSNTSVKYGDALILKLFRRLEDGISPELEIGRFLAERGFQNTPPLAGAIEYVPGDVAGEPQTLAILQGFVPNQGDAWSYIQRSLEEYYDDQPSSAPPYDLRPEINESVALLGQRTAQMHATLASDPDDPAFAPEHFTAEYQAAMHGSMRALTEEAFRLLRGRVDRLPDEARDEAAAILLQQDAILARFDPLLTHHVKAMRTRCHGDYHLGQVLWTGNDFVIIDFEGEPVRTLAERRLKHSPLKDVAGMLRSFHYAAYAGMFDSIDKRGPQEQIELRADSWYREVSATYLRSYRTTAGNASWLPATEADLRLLLDAHLLEKAVYELLYEINMRPDWVQIPLKGILQLQSDQ